jgi:hypothetical protein
MSFIKSAWNGTKNFFKEIGHGYTSITEDGLLKSVKNIDGIAAGLAYPVALVSFGLLRGPIGVLGYNALRNPTYYYTGNDDTRYEVKPRKAFVFHKLNRDFAHAADFKKNVIWDANLETRQETSFSLAPNLAGGNYSQLVPVSNTETVREWKYSNGKAFDEVSAPAGKAEIDDLRATLVQAQREHGRSFRLRLP